MKEWMAQADPSKEARMFVRMNGRLELLSSSKRTHFLKMVESGVLKNYIAFTKIWCFKYILFTIAIPKN